VLLESRDHARLQASVDRLTGLRDDILAALRLQEGDFRSRD
jgi:hypothetical protein